MKIIRAGLLALALPLLLAATPVKAPAKPAPVKSAPAKAAPAKAVAKAAPVRARPKPQPAAVWTDAPKTYPLQTINFPNGVTMTQMVYRKLEGYRPLTMDVYQPAGKSFPLPGLVYVHGGYWKHGDPRHGGTFGDFPGLLAELAARGFVVAAVEYRLSGEAHFPAALQDVKSAVRWLRGHAGDYNLDPTRVAIWGASAGGQLAALTGVSCGVSTLEPEDIPKDAPPNDCVQAVIDWYGFIDFENLHNDFGKPAPDKTEEGDYLGCEPALCPVGFARNASPLTYIEPMSPPFLIQHGAEDVIVSPKQSQELYDALRAKDVPAELVIYPGVAHDFARVPAAPDPDTNKAVVEKLEAFLDATFPKKPADSAYKPPKRKGLPY